MYINTTIICNNLPYELPQDKEFNIEFFYLSYGSQIKSIFIIYRVFQFREYENRFEIYHSYCNKYGKTVLSKKNIFWRYV